MTHDGKGSCHCRRCNNLRHERECRAIKVAVSAKYKGAVYVDQVNQYHGKTVVRRNGHEEIGNWINAGMASGTFDLFVCAFGRVIFLDVKTGGGKLTQEQLEFQSWIRAAGGIAESVRSPEHAIEIIERELT